MVFEYPFTKEETRQALDELELLIAKGYAPWQMKILGQDVQVVPLLLAHIRALELEKRNSAPSPAPTTDAQLTSPTNSVVPEIRYPEQNTEDPVVDPTILGKEPAEAKPFTEPKEDIKPL